MLDVSSYLVFLGASVALILVPGPAQALVTARTLAAGRYQGAFTAVGLNVGTLFHAAVAGLGLSAILATSAVAFSVVKYVGAAYLIYLGLRALRSKVAFSLPASAGPDQSDLAALGQAVAAGILNPKVALFFLAFLPQFVDPSRGAVVVQFLILGASMALLDIAYELVLVYLVSRVRERYLRSPKLVAWQTRIAGVMLVALGLRLAAQER
jgi:threonine/homoserine/homoserine lactone efflux protein